MSANRIIGSKRYICSYELTTLMRKVTGFFTNGEPAFERIPVKEVK